MPTREITAYRLLESTPSMKPTITYSTLTGVSRTEEGEDAGGEDGEWLPMPPIGYCGGPLDGEGQDTGMYIIPIARASPRNEEEQTPRDYVYFFFSSQGLVQRTPMQFE